MCLLREKGSTKNKTHLEIDIKNGINCTTGSLGYGLPISTGMHFKKKTKNPGKNLVMISDGNVKKVRGKCF